MVRKKLLQAAALGSERGFVYTHKKNSNWKRQLSVLVEVKQNDMKWIIKELSILWWNLDNNLGIQINININLYIYINF